MLTSLLKDVINNMSQQLDEDMGIGTKQSNFHLHGAWGPAQLAVEAFWVPSHGSYQEKHQNAVSLGLI